MINKELEKKVSDLKESFINRDLISEIEDVKAKGEQFDKDAFERQFASILSDNPSLAENNKKPIKCYICETDKRKNFYSNPGNQWLVSKTFLDICTINNKYATTSFWGEKEYYFCDLCKNALDDKYGTFHSYYLSPTMIEDIKNIDNFKERMLPLRETQVELMINAIYDKIERGRKEKKRLIDEEVLELKFKIECKTQIVELLKEKNIKISVSDIDSFLKHQNVDEIKEFCEELYNDGEISFAGNGRYFILSDEKKKSTHKKTASPKSEAVDVKAELKKYKEMLDDGLITQEQYDAKSNELLGL